MLRLLNVSPNLTCCREINRIVAIVYAAQQRIRLFIEEERGGGRIRIPDRGELKVFLNARMNINRCARIISREPPKTAFRS